MQRRFSLTGKFRQILKEQSFLHNKQNGLEITYYPNGTIQTIDYYLNGKLWDVISRSDSNGRLQNPGNLHNGNGVRFFFDQFGVEPNCYMTYQKGVPEGLFYWQSSLMTYVKGELKYKESIVRYLPAKKVTYTNPQGRTITTVFDTSLYRSVFVANPNIDLKVLSVTDDSLQEQPRDYKYIDINFDDPAIIPTGTWQIVNTKTGKVLTSVVYDNNGNPIKVTRFKENGDALSEKVLPSYDTRKW